MRRFVRFSILPAALGFVLLASGCSGDNESTSGITGKTDTSAPPTEYGKQSRGGKSDFKPSTDAKPYPGAAKK